MNGWIVVFWPVTNVAMAVSAANDSMQVPEGAVFVPEIETGGVMPEIYPQPQTPEQRETEQRNTLLDCSQLAANQKSALANRIGVINDNIDFGDTTEDEQEELELRKSQLVAWKKYAGALGKVTSQSGWYENVNWPIQPETGMDLSVSPLGRA